MVNDNPALTTAQTLGKSWPTNWTYVNMLDTPGSTLKPWQNTRCNLFKSSLDGCVTWLSRSLLTRDSEQPIRVTEKADVALLAELGILGNVIATLELETKVAVISHIYEDGWFYGLSSQYATTTDGRVELR